MPGAPRVSASSAACAAASTCSAGLAGPALVPGGRAVKQAVAQHDPVDAGRAEHLLLHVGRALDGDGARRIGQVERIGLGMRLAAGRIGKRDALHDEAARRRGRRRRNQVAGAFGADARIERIGGSNLRLVEFARQIGELMDDDLGLRAAHRMRSPPGASKTSRTAGVDPCPLELLALGGGAGGAGHRMTGSKKQRHKTPADGARGAGKEHRMASRDR